MRLCGSIGCVLGAAMLAVVTIPAAAQSKNLAPGFGALPKGTRVVIMPTDIELFSISGGGVLEPKADWTEAASKHFKAAMIEKKQKLGLSSVELNTQSSVSSTAVSPDELTMFFSSTRSGN